MKISWTPPKECRLEESLDAELAGTWAALKYESKMLTFLNIFQEVLYKNNLVQCFIAYY